MAPPVECGVPPATGTKHPPILAHAACRSAADWCFGWRFIWYWRVRAPGLYWILPGHFTNIFGNRHSREDFRRAVRMKDSKGLPTTNATIYLRQPHWQSNTHSFVGETRRSVPRGSKRLTVGRVLVDWQMCVFVCGFARGRISVLVDTSRQGDGRFDMTKCWIQCESVKIKWEYSAVWNCVKFNLVSSTAKIW